MATARDVLASKRIDRIFTCGPEDSVLSALRSMAEHDVGSLIVVESDVILGLVSERDYARKVVLAGRASSSTPVRAIMRPEIRCVAPSTSVDECRAIMTEDKIRYVPVVEDGYLAGLISIGDLVRHAIKEKDFLIEQLTQYVTGAHQVKTRPS